MKKFLILLICLTVFVLPFSVFAKENEASLSATDQKVDEYTLPYPGILPDNPLYAVKAIRDRIVGFLISDPLKKASFNLLQADKRLQAGVALVDKDKKKHADLAESTVSKAENYFEEAIRKAEEAKIQGMATDQIVSQLSQSVYKHDEIMAELIKKLSDDAKKRLQITHKRVTLFKERVEKLLS